MTLGDERTEELAEAIMIHFECRDQVFPTPSVRDFQDSRIADLERELEHERGKEPCRECNTTGKLVGANCHVCRGEGMHHVSERHLYTDRGRKWPHWKR